MVVVVVRFPVQSAFEAEAIEARFRARAGIVDSQPGFEGFELLGDDAELVSVTRWKTRADLERWMSSESNREAHGSGDRSLRPGARPPGTVSVYEVLLPSTGGR